MSTPKHVTYTHKLYPADYIPKAGRGKTALRKPRKRLKDELIDKLLLAWLQRQDQDLKFELGDNDARKLLLQAIIKTTFDKSPYKEDWEVGSALSRAVKILPYALKRAYFYVYVPRLLIQGELPDIWARRKKTGLRIFKNELHKLAQQEPSLKWVDYNDVSEATKADIEKKKEHQKDLDQLRLFMSEWREIINDFLVVAYEDHHFFPLAIKLYKDDLAALYLLESKVATNAALNAELPDYIGDQKKKLENKSEQDYERELTRKHTGKVVNDHFKKALDLSKNRSRKTSKKVLSAREEALRKYWEGIPDKVFEDLCVTIEQLMYSDIKKRLILSYMLETFTSPQSDLEVVLRILRNKNPPRDLIHDLRKKLAQDLSQAYELPYAPALGITSAGGKGVLTQLRGLLDYALLDLGLKGTLQHKTLYWWHTPQRRKDYKAHLQDQYRSVAEEQLNQALPKVFRPFQLMFKSSRRQLIRAVLYLLAGSNIERQQMLDLLKQPLKVTPKTDQPPKQLLKEPVVATQNALHLDLKNYLANQRGAKKLANYPTDTKKAVTRLLGEACGQVGKKSLSDLYHIPQVKNLVFEVKNRGRKQGSVVYLTQADLDEVFNVEIYPTANMDDKLVFRAVNPFKAKQDEITKKEERLQQKSPVTDQNVLGLAKTLINSTNEKEMQLKAQELTRERLDNQKDWNRQLDEYLKNGMNYAGAATQKQKVTLKIRDLIRKLQQTTDLIKILGTKEISDTVWQNWKQDGQGETWAGPNEIVNEVSKVLNKAITERINQLTNKITQQEDQEELEDQEFSVFEAWKTLEKIGKNSTNTHQEKVPQTWKKHPKWTKTDTDHRNIIQDLIIHNQLTWDKLLLTWIDLRTTKTQKNKQPKDHEPTTQEITALLTTLTELLLLLPKEGLTEQIRAQTKRQKRFKGYRLREEGHHMYLDSIFTIPTWKGKQKGKQTVTAGDRGIRTPVFLTNKTPGHPKALGLKNEPVRQKQQRQNEDLRYTQRNVSKTIPPGLEGEAYKKALAEAPTHIQKTAQKIQSVHAKKYRMNQTYMLEMAARTSEFTLWTETGEYLLEYLDYQAPAGLGSLSQALSSNMWGSYLSKTQFHFYKTNQQIHISYIPPQYSSQICNRYLALQVPTLKTTRPPKPIKVSELVTETCYPVARPGSKIRDNTGEWFYCAGHDSQLEKWINRDQNASANFPELQWIYNHNTHLKEHSSKTYQASTPLGGGDLKRSLN